MRTHHALQPRSPEQASYSIGRRDGKQFFQYIHGCKVFCSQAGECPTRRPGTPPDSDCQRFSVSCMQRTDMPAARPPLSFHVPCDVR